MFLFQIIHSLKFSISFSSFLQIPMNLIFRHRSSQNNGPTINPYLVDAPDRNEIIQLSSDPPSETDPYSDAKEKPTTTQQMVSKWRILEIGGYIYCSNNIPV